MYWLSWRRFDEIVRVLNDNCRMGRNDKRILDDRNMAEVKIRNYAPELNQGKSASMEFKQHD